MVTPRLKAAVERALFKRKTLNPNLAGSMKPFGVFEPMKRPSTDSEFTDVGPSRGFQSLVGQSDRSFQDKVSEAIRELQEAVSQLQQLQVAATEVDSGGGAKHSAVSQTFRGQFLRITSLGEDVLVAVPHGLGRKPQGGIWVEALSFNKIYIQADRSSASEPVPAADESLVYVRMGGAASEEATLLLF